VKKGSVEADLGDSFVVRVGQTPQVVKKAAIDANRTNDGGWWSSMDLFADKCVAEAEEWVATVQGYLDDIDTEIAELRKQREDTVATAQHELDKTRKWRAEFKFDEEAFAS
jgi:hypothetical protein